MTTKCANCRNELDSLDTFPGDVCVDCYANSPAGRYMPTASELTRMWGGK